MTLCSDNCYECNGWPIDDLCEDLGHCFCIDISRGRVQCCECGEVMSD